MELGGLMNRLDRRIEDVLKRNERFLCCLLPLGDPDLKTSRELVELYLESGADVVELVMPSQDPYLDSRQLSQSAMCAIRAESDYSEYFKAIKQIRQDYPNEPFEVMTYSDVVEGYGVAKFVEGLGVAGMDAHLLADAAVIAPKIIDEMDPLLEAASIHRIRFMPHPFQEGLLPDIAENGRGFMILQSITDETGKRPSVMEGNRELIDRVRDTGTRASIMLGYGINNSIRAREAVNLGTDGIIVGSVLLAKIASEDYDGLVELIKGIKGAMIL